MRDFQGNFTVHIGRKSGVRVPGMRPSWIVGVGTTVVGAGLNVLLAIVQHPPHVLYFVGWGLVGVGVLVCAWGLVAWRQRKANLGERDDRAPGRIGYKGRPGSTGTFRRTRFGDGLDVDIDNEGDIDVDDSDLR